MKESEVNVLGVRALECLCEDLAPTSVSDGEALDVEEQATPLHLEESFDTCLSHAESEVVLDKPKRTWKRKIYDLSVVRRCERIKFKRKFHDEK